MNESTRVTIIFILAIILLLAVAFLGSGLLLRRALKVVIRTFRENGALTPEKALTAESLNLLPKGLFRARGLRDYRPAALQYLMRYQIILATEDGRLYLSEDALFQSGIESKIGKM